VSQISAEIAASMPVPATAWQGGRALRMLARWQW
jgi:hypothetical protein